MLRALVLVTRNNGEIAALSGILERINLDRYLTALYIPQVEDERVAPVSL